MTTEEETSSVPITAVLAKLVLLAERRHLAQPKAIGAVHYRSGHLAVSVELGSNDDLRAWLKAAGGKVGDIKAMDVLANNHRHYAARLRGWAGTGWDVELTFDADLSHAAPPLDTETVAALEKVAAGESSPEISIERYDELVDLLNAYRTWEYDPGDGTALLADANLGEAMRWIADQPDVAETAGPNPDDTAEVTLTDGTVIAWIASERSWSVTVTEDAAEPEHNQYTRPWRTQVQIVAQDPGRGITSVRIPARDNDSERIGLDLGFDFPAWLAELPVGTRVYADVNVGAESAEDLVFTNWTKS